MSQGGSHLVALTPGATAGGYLVKAFDLLRAIGLVATDQGAYRAALTTFTNALKQHGWVSRDSAVREVLVSNALWGEASDLLKRSNRRINHDIFRKALARRLEEFEEHDPTDETCFQIGLQSPDGAIAAIRGRGLKRGADFTSASIIFEADTTDVAALIAPLEDEGLLDRYNDLSYEITQSGTRTHAARLTSGPGRDGHSETLMLEQRDPDLRAAAATLSDAPARPLTITRRWDCRYI